MKALLWEDHSEGKDTYHLNGKNNLYSSNLPHAMVEEVVDDSRVLYDWSSVNDSWVILVLPKLPRAMKI